LALEYLSRLDARNRQFLAGLDWPEGTPAHVTSMVPPGFASYSAVLNGNRTALAPFGTLSAGATRNMLDLLPVQVGVGCVFGVWDGYGWEADELLPPTVEIPNRRLMCFRGDCTDALVVAVRGLGYQSPTLWWPDDLSWCVRTDVDGYVSLVAGSKSCADVLASHPDLVAWRVMPSTLVTSISAPR
jgi:hypothetical protein